MEKHQITQKALKAIEAIVDSPVLSGAEQAGIVMYILGCDLHTARSLILFVRNWKIV